MTNQDEIPSVSMSNTKKEMLEAYQAMKQKLKDIRAKYKDSDELDQHFIELYKEKGIIKE